MNDDFMEPVWSDVKRRLSALTLSELRPVKRLFGGSLGGATTKRETVDEMVGQMQHWWKLDFIAQLRVNNVLAELYRVEEAKRKDREHDQGGESDG